MRISKRDQGGNVPAAGTQPIVRRWRERAQRLRHGAVAAVPPALLADEETDYRGLVAALLEHAFDGIVLSSAEDERILECSESACDLSGYTRAELIGHTAIELGLVEPEAHAEAMRTATERRSSASVETRMRRKDGETRWVEFSTQLLAGHDLLLTIFHDVTTRKQQAERLRELADRDPLTHLFNRRRFFEELDRRILESRRHGDSLTLVLADVDHLKEINDEHGHQAGDEALRTVATRLKRALRRTDIVARMGGDEFAAILVRTEREAGKVVMERLEHDLREVTVGSGGREPVAVSLGSAELDYGGGDAETLLRAADEAMYAEKQARRVGR